MQPSDYWRTLFETWPKEIERRGTVILKQGESVVFEDFLLSPGLLLLSRSSPDASGNRKAFVAFHLVAVVKMPTPMDLSQFKAMGFRPPRPKPPTSPKPAGAAQTAPAPRRPTG